MAYAHSHPNRQEEWQSLEDHLNAVSHLAAQFAEVFAARQWGHAAGLLHDIDKCKPAFQKYLLDSVDDPNPGPSGIDHSTAGAQLAVQLSSSFGKILAYALAGHHAGLPDGLGTGSSLEKRLQKELSDCAQLMAEELDIDFPEGLPFQPSQGRLAFQLSFFIRMQFSCLVDADFLDTESFMDPEKHSQRNQYPTISDLADRFFPKLQRMVSNAQTTQVNKIRKKVLNECLENAKSKPGIYSLTVPTGGGKTLSSLAFALNHAQHCGHSRIIYVIPYMSIIEQNAAVFQHFLGSEAVLEHHSSFDFDVGEEKENIASYRAKLAAENWDAPIITTTSVQFFESLFSAKPSKCRKLHNIANSLIILDEAQMLPQEFLNPCLEALRELTTNYKATVVLCTATQPALSKRDDFTQGLGDVKEIISDPAHLHEALKRVRVQHIGKLDDQELASQLTDYNQVLCITNTRGHARRIFDFLVQETEDVFHLSANMCAAHRSAKLQEIREALTDNRPCRVISTQLIEAGVDVDFPVAYRAAAGIDSIAQAAGRCDREGKLTQDLGSPAGKVYVFQTENGLPPGHFRVTADIAQEVMRAHEDVLSPEAVKMYFRHLFWKAGPDLDQKHILHKLEEDIYRGNIPFREVAKTFQIIEDYQQTIIVPIDEEAEEMVDSLPYVTSPKGLLRRLQRYTVQIPERIYHQLLSSGAVELVADSYPVLRNMDIYRDDIGLCPEDPTYREVENLII